MGIGCGAGGSGSACARRHDVVSITPVSRSVSSSALRFRSSRVRFLPGCTNAGLFGSAANMALSAHDSFSGSRPKYRHEAASIPTTFPPNGACDAYSARMSFLLNESSSLSAIAISISFSRNVRGRCRMRRMTCIVIVLAPLTTPRARRFCPTARMNASGSTP